MDGHDVAPTKKATSCAIVTSSFVVHNRWRTPVGRLHKAAMPFQAEAHQAYNYL